jgi:hypothetical protein
VTCAKKRIILHFFVWFISTLRALFSVRDIDLAWPRTWAHRTSGGASFKLRVKNYRRTASYWEHWSGLLMRRIGVVCSVLCERLEVAWGPRLGFHWNWNYVWGQRLGQLQVLFHIHFVSSLIKHFWSENLKRREHSQDLGIDEIVLEWLSGI